MGWVDSAPLESYVDFTDCPAFFNEVAAYPAVTIIRKGKGDITLPRRWELSFVRQLLEPRDGAPSPSVISPLF